MVPKCHKTGSNVGQASLHGVRFGCTGFNFSSSVSQASVFNRHTFGFSLCVFDDFNIIHSD